MCHCVHGLAGPRPVKCLFNQLVIRTAAIRIRCVGRGICSKNRQMAADWLASPPWLRRSLSVELPVASSFEIHLFKVLSHRNCVPPHSDCDEEDVAIPWRTRTV